MRHIGQRSSYDRTDRSERSRLPTKFAIYDPGKPKRTSFHDVTGRYLPPLSVTIRSNARVVRENEEGIGRGTLVLKEPKDAADTYTCKYVCVCVRAYIYITCVYICTRDCQNKFAPRRCSATLRNSTVAAPPRFSRTNPFPSARESIFRRLDELLRQS